jgi:hypothetical protein
MQQGIWHSASPGDDRELDELVRRAPIELPAEYLAYLRKSDGGGGDIPDQPWVFFFWKANEVHSSNDGYEVGRNVPGFYAFGTSGGGEMFAFDARQRKPWPIVVVPFIPMDAKEAIQIAPDFASFRKMFGLCNGEPVNEIRLDDRGHPVDPDAS